MEKEVPPFHFSYQSPITACRAALPPTLVLRKRKTFVWFVTANDHSSQRKMEVMHSGIITLTPKHTLSSVMVSDSQLLNRDIAVTMAAWHAIDSHNRTCHEETRKERLFQGVRSNHSFSFWPKVLRSFGLP